MDNSDIIKKNKEVEKLTSKDLNSIKDIYFNRLETLMEDDKWLNSNSNDVLSEEMYMDNNSWGI